MARAVLIVVLVLAPAARAQVDLALVLAVDSSASIDDREFALQMAGIAAAFRDPQVVAAIAGGPQGRIAVNAMIWAESGYPTADTGWHVVAGAAEAEAFARTVERFPRTIKGGTGLGAAVLRGVRLLEDVRIPAARRVIDVSGDGRETTFREWRITPAQARNVAVARGITVNGLALLNDDAGLDAYYRAEVVGGADSFVMVARTIADFAAAMRNKLLREIDYRPLVGAVARPSYKVSAAPVGTMPSSP